MDTGSSCSSGGEPEEQSTVEAVPVIAATFKKKRSADGRESKRFAKKRVVSVPIADLSSNVTKWGGGGEGALPPPSDSWAWRKYGQKPIKGSPYPRGYYRCSSSKGCPARKQVERSRTDPTMVLVTYTSEHNHAWPLLPKSQHRPKALQLPSPEAELQPEEKELAEELQAATNSAPSTSPEGSFSVDLTEETPLLLGPDHEFCWFPGVGLTEDPTVSGTAAMFDDCSFGSIGGGGNVGMLLPMVDDDVGNDELGYGDEGDDENSLFAGLEELPEFAIVFRRSSVGRR